MITPRWIYKLRKSKGKFGIERTIRIPPEIADQLGQYVKITLIDGKLVIEPYNENSTLTTESDNVSQEVS